MTTKHYSDAGGNYIGGFGDGAQPPAGAIERPAPPSADAIWSDGAWTLLPPVPYEITKVQFVRAMRQMNLWDTHKATIEAHEDWPYITAIPRNDSMTLQMAQVIGATEQEMNDLWTLGATL